MEDKFPSLEEWGRSPIMTFLKNQDRIVKGWAVAITQMSEDDRKKVLDHMFKTSPHIYRLVSSVLQDMVLDRLNQIGEKK
jgi:hypothetical protein